MTKWPEIEGFELHIDYEWTECAAIYRKLGWSGGDKYSWIICYKNGDVLIQTLRMTTSSKEGIQCKTLDEAVTIVNAMCALTE